MSKKLIVLLLIDGARSDVMQELLEMGDLPNIKREIVKNGTFRTACSCAPSTTGPAYLPFLTGFFPGSINIPGIRWLDKAEFKKRIFSINRLRSYNGIEQIFLNYDLPLKIKTLFNYFENPYNIFSMITRGLPRGHNLTSIIKTFAYTYAHLTDQWGSVDRIAARRLLRAIEYEPDFIFAVFPNVDSFSHLFHPRHDKTIAAYRYVDYAVGKFVEELKKKKRWEETLLIITSDHGLTPTNHHLDLAHFFENRKLSTLFYPIIWKLKPKLSVMISGNAMAQVYFLDISPDEQCDINRIKEILGSIWFELLDRPEIDIVIGRAGRNSFIIESKRGRALITSQNGLTYRPIQGDPLGYGPITTPLDSLGALKITFDSNYPDALIQIAQLFSAPRCGDLVVISKNGCDLRKEFEWPEHHASHGSLHREHMIVPLIYNESGWHERPARTADLFNTILKWSGRETVAKSDGQSLI